MAAIPHPTPQPLIFIKKTNQKATYCTDVSIFIGRKKNSIFKEILLWNVNFTFTSRPKYILNRTIVILSDSYTCMYNLIAGIGVYAEKEFGNCG